MAATMKIEINDTISKHLFRFSPEIESEETRQKNKIALEKLLCSEPTCNISNQHKNTESSTLSKHQLAEYRDAFYLFDEDEDGKVTLEELRSVMLNLKQYIKVNELRDILLENNIQDEYVDFEQFIRVAQSSQLDQDLKDVFRVFVKSNSEYIYPSELKSIWQSFGISLNNEEIDEMMNEVDIDGDGRISYDEFVNALNTLELEDNDNNIMHNDSNI